MKIVLWLYSLFFAAWGVCLGQQVTNADLPPQAKAADGIVSLWADFDKADEKSVPLYLINKTPAPVTFSSQDGDLYIKLETRDAKGAWVRAQAHQYSDCGNSYVPLVLRPGMHFRLHGYHPASGRKAQVRYAMHSGQALISNVGEGVVSDAVVEVARFDAMSLNGVPRTLRDAFDPERRREGISPKDLSDCLLLLHAYGPVPALKREAERQLDAWRSSAASSNAEKRATTTFAKILASPWPEDISSERLLRLCTGRIEGKTEGQAVSPSLAWKVVGNLSVVQFGPNWNPRPIPPTEKLSDDWQRVTKLALSCIAKATREEAAGMCAVLSGSLLTGAFVTLEDLETVLKSPPNSATMPVIKELARRGCTEKLAELGMSLPPECQPAVLAALASNGRMHVQTDLADSKRLRQPKPGTQEELFWRHVMATQPVQAVHELGRVASPYLSEVSYSPMVLEGLRSYWRKQAEHSDDVNADFVVPDSSFLLESSVRFLSRMNNPKDEVLYWSLLTYRGYDQVDGYRDGGVPELKLPVKKRKFGVRQAALAALKNLGVTVPLKVVIERDVSDPKHVIEKTHDEQR